MNPIRRKILKLLPISLLSVPIIISNFAKNFHNFKILKIKKNSKYFWYLNEKD